MGGHKFEFAFERLVTCEGKEEKGTAVQGLGPICPKKSPRKDHLSRGVAYHCWFGDGLNIPPWMAHASHARPADPTSSASFQVLVWLVPLCSLIDGVDRGRHASDKLLSTVVERVKEEG